MQGRLALVSMGIFILRKLLKDSGENHFYYNTILNEIKYRKRNVFQKMDKPAFHRNALWVEKYSYQ
ncbi:MAG TPA: hypothetical protein PLV32_06015, partial [Chitinophagaceae bacterium]|nr:hypothetical protein [Chitinophagaceae bacterium]